MPELSIDFLNGILYNYVKENYREDKFMPIVKLNSQNYDETVLNDKVIVDFWAEWCGPCKMLAPVLEAFAEKHPEYIIGKVNVDEEPSLAAKFRIMSIPTLKIYSKGECIKEGIGYKSLDQLEELAL